MEDDVHVGTYSRNNNPGAIIIQDEIIYKVAEWFVSPDYIETEEGTTWEEITSRTSKGLNGTHSDAVRVVEPDTTLYVKLVVKPPGEGYLEITESQITKAVETIDSNIPGWGRQTLNFSYSDLNGTCGYTYTSTSYCSSCENCSGRGASYTLKDSEHEFRFKNVAKIRDRLQANVGVFKALHYPYNGVAHTRGLDAGTYGVDAFSYQMVLWRGKDVPTIAGYKESSTHELNTLLNRYGKQPAGNRLNTVYR